MKRTFGIVAVSKPRVASPIRVRSLRAGDIAACAKLVAAIPLWQRYGYSEARCARDLRSALQRRDILKVAVSGGALAGLAWVLPRAGFGRMAYLKLIAVAPDDRGRGIGAKLLEAAEGGRDLLLLVSDFNRRARRFYAAHGYRRIGAIPALVLPDVTELLLLKRASTLAVEPVARLEGSPTVRSRRRGARPATANREAARPRSS